MKKCFFQKKDLFEKQKGPGINPYMHVASYMIRSAKIFILNLEEEIMEKILYERCTHESVDDGSQS